MPNKAALRILANMGDHPSWASSGKKLILRVYSKRFDKNQDNMHFLLGKRPDLRQSLTCKREMRPLRYRLHKYLYKGESWPPLPKKLRSIFMRRTSKSKYSKNKARFSPRP